MMERRKFLSLGISGFSLPQILALRSATEASGVASANRGFGRAKSCIVLFAWGGLSHHDTFDLKPNAPANIRTRFREIPTDIPGTRVSEHLPRFAKMMKHWALVRSVHHNSPSHRSGAYWNLTGHEPPNPTGNWPATRDDWPSLGSMIWQALGDGHGAIPGAVALPYTLYDGGTANGQDGGFLGLVRDPAVIRPNSSTPLKMYGGRSPTSGHVQLELPEQVDLQRLERRRSLIKGFENSSTGNPNEGQATIRLRETALDMLLDPKVSDAFDIEQEPTHLRETYGMHICGQSALMARRLTETGIPVATVYCAAGDLNGSKGDHFDTHANNFNRLKDNMLPPLDQTAYALIEDLRQRGRLDETLVVLLTEFGRTPKINGAAGRDHYPNCYTVAFAGGGIQGGQSYGKSDSMGAHPADKPCSPADLHATIFHALGIDPRHTIPARDGRPLPMCDGNPLPLFA